MYIASMARTIPKDRFHDLLEAATAVFLEQGYRRTQMADVAARMGVAKGTLYLYVESKDALFDAVLRHADSADPIELPSRLPVAAPPRDTTLEMVRKRVSESAVLPTLAAALERRRVGDVNAELEAILRELYAVLAGNRTGITLLDRCAADHPELAAIWFGTGREGALALLNHYLGDRIARGKLRPVVDLDVTARITLETIVFWAVHRYWDPSPQAVDDATAENCAVEFIVRSLAKE
jgi:AcrR family transcriptional regulator